jgi:pimeloyl-ACP methyl ester carboxylesterase
VHLAGNSLGGWIALELARRGRAGSVAALGPAGLETPVERLAVIAANEPMRARAVTIAPMTRLLTATPAAPSALLGGLRARSWRLPADDTAAEIRDFAHAPGVQATLRWTTGFRFASS